MLVSNVSGTTATVTRGVDGTTPVAHGTNFTVYAVVPASVLSNFAQFLVTEWYNVKTQGGALGNGSTDDTTALNNAIAVVQANTSGNGVVYFPTGVYVTSAPLVVNTGGVTLMGSGPLATQGGGGSGSGTFTPGTAGGVSGELKAGSVIAPSSSWAQGGAIAPAAVLLDSSASQVSKVSFERLWVDGNKAGTTTVHGFAAYGEASAFSVLGCGALILYSVSSNGIYLMPSNSGDPVGAQEPDGTMIDRCLMQSIGNNGFQGSCGDATITKVHTQGIGGNGFYFTVTNAGGGNIRVSDCRADLGTNGYVTDVSCGSYLGMVQFSNCSTQRNSNNGWYIQNTAGGDICPVYLSNCVAQGDGTAGGTNAAFRISGPCMAMFANCASHIDTVDVGGGCPPYAFATTSGGVSPPVLVQVNGGFFNSKTGFKDTINAPLQNTAGVIQAYYWTGSQWTPSDTPSVAATSW
jgi:hypothetical protein